MSGVVEDGAAVDVLAAVGDEGRKAVIHLGLVQIQRQLDRGAFREPAELLAHALDLVEAEAVEQDWLLRNKDAINAALDESFASMERGEGYTPEESQALLARDRAARKSKAA